MAWMSWSLVLVWTSTTTPSSTSIPASSASSAAGSAPTPATTTSASSVVPSDRVRRAPPPAGSAATTVVLKTIRTPCAAWWSARKVETVAETLRDMTRSAASTTVTSQPNCRAVAATSMPITPAPMTTNRGAAARRPRRRSLSAKERR